MLLQQARKLSDIELKTFVFYNYYTIISNGFHLVIVSMSMWPMHINISVHKGIKYD